MSRRSRLLLVVLVLAIAIAAACWQPQADAPVRIDATSLFGWHASLVDATAAVLS